MDRRLAVSGAVLLLAAAAGVALLLTGSRPGSSPASPSGAVDVRVVAQALSPTRLTFQVSIANRTGGDVYLVDDPRRPGVEATPTSLTLHYDVEDFPPGTLANVNIFPVPAFTVVPAGGTVTRRAEVLNPVALSNWLGLHWDTTAEPPVYLRRVPSVTMLFPLEVRAVVGYGSGPFEYTTATVPQDQRLAFLLWQRRAASPAVTLTP